MLYQNKIKPIFSKFYLKQNIEGKYTKLNEVQHQLLLLWKGNFFVAQLFYSFYVSFYSSFLPFQFFGH
jgi:TM2 domain-containing membrane protein YozV